MREKILLVNPPVYDFASYDFWLKPLGLMYLASSLKTGGKDIRFFDSMYRFHPLAPPSPSDRWGRGKFFSQPAKKPDILSHIPRRYKRYGLPEKFLKEVIKSKKWDYIMVTTTMTYWYPGAIEVLKLARKYQGGATVILGGIYPSLMKEHAETLGFDLVISNNELQQLKDIMGVSVPEDFTDYPLPYYEPYLNSPYAVYMTGVGCPFRCIYCATPFLHKKISQKAPEIVISEIKDIVKMGFKNIVFYDDALLFPKDRAKQIFEGIIKAGLNIDIHTPNGLGVRFIDMEMANLMKKAGFVNLYLSLETTNERFQKESGGKLKTEEFINAVNYLYKASFKPENLNAYILCGIPGISKNDVIESIKLANSFGVRVMLSEYSPIPHTKLYEKMRLNGLDPLWHNNTIFPYYMKNMEQVQELKDFLRNLQRK